MINIKINEHYLLILLMNRFAEISNFDEDTEEYKLFEEMYQNNIENGFFDGCELNINVIVDNDYINNTSFIGEKHCDYDKIKELYEQNLYDISETNDLGYSFIEASNKDKTLFLVSY